jgi:hypothetical protein
MMYTNDIAVIRKGEVSMAQGDPPLRYTRTDLCERFKTTTTELDTLERQGILVPTRPGSAGRGKPALYSETGVAIAGAIIQVGRLGLRGRFLGHFAELMRGIEPRLRPGWSGLVAYDGGSVALLGDAGDIPEFMTGYRSPTGLILIPIDIPAEAGELL